MKHWFKITGLVLLFTLYFLFSPWSESKAAGSAPERIAISDLPTEISSGRATRLDALPNTLPIRLEIVLMPKRDDLAAAALQVTNPNSSNYRHFLSFSEWRVRFMPTSKTVDSIAKWASSTGLTVVKRWPTNQAIVVQGSIGQVSRLFRTSISHYKQGSQTFYSNDSAPSVPAALASKIADVLGLSSFTIVTPSGFGTAHVSFDTSKPNVKKTAFIERSEMHLNADPARAFGRRLRPAYTGPLRLTDLEPSDIWSSEFYDYQALQAQRHCCNPAHLANGSPPETSIAVIAQDYPATSDIKGFASTFNLAISYVPTLVGGPSCCDSEATLDVEWANAMSNSLASAADTASIYLYAGSNSVSGFYDAWQEALSDNKARVASTSFGYDETDYGGNGGILKKSIGDFRDITNSMVLLGWTLVAAAGDSGGDFLCERGAVNYPASDPNVVAAGGTQLSFLFGTYGFSYQKETAWSGNACATSTNTNAGGGGGGCSDTFHAPAWQSASACPAGKRALPDISLHTGTPGDPFNANYVSYYSYGGCAKSLCISGGTSFVAPMLAGFFAQENAYRLALGLQGAICGPQHNAACGPVGAGGPALYNAQYGPHNPFYDILVGCTANGMSAGHCAGPGYDLATGLGSANMLQLAWSINAFLDGPPAVPPIVTLNGPPLSEYYATPQTVSMTASGGSLGLAGYTLALDYDPGDPKSEQGPGAGKPFWDGPAVLNSTTGSYTVPATGCHTVYARVWNNSGSSTVASYGPVCVGQLSSCQFQVLPCTTGVSGPPSYAFTCPMAVDFSQSTGGSPFRFVQFADALDGEENDYAGAVQACIPGSTQCLTFSTDTTAICNGGSGSGGGVTPPPRTCVKCGGLKCCPAPDGGPGKVCVAANQSCPVLN